MGSKSVTRIEFDTVVNGLDVCIGFTRTVKFSLENYGADADGNRGMLVNTLDDDEYAQISVEWEDTQSNHVFPAEALSDVLSLTDVERAIERYIETHEPEPPDEPERDYDDQDEDE